MPEETPVIVVPLDGSDLSEAALPYARLFARATGSKLLLVTVWDTAEQRLLSRLPDVPGDIEQRALDYCRDYLTGVANGLAAEGVEVETTVLAGDTVEELVRLLDERAARLLIMATHGRSGLGRWWYGSVASRLVRQAPVPTLVLGPRVLEQRRDVQDIRRILVPLDGSPFAETALGPALDLARRLDADVTLARAVWAGAYVFPAVSGVEAMEVARALAEEAHVYLERVRQELGAGALVDIQVLQGVPAQALLDLVERGSYDLVVMASHARAGLARALLGSVADRMLHGAAPVLLIRPEAARAERPVVRGRFCANCGWRVPYGTIEEDDRCLRCGQHLHVCANCVYYDGISCLLQRQVEEERVLVAACVGLKTDR
jgi:nucleotide-binding universal stress UspA family protein